MGLLEKVRHVMLGADHYDEDEMYVEDYIEEEEAEEEMPVRYVREKSRARERDVRDLRAVGGGSYRRETSSHSNVVSLPTAAYHEQSRIVISCPQTMDDATMICEHLKANVACVVDLTGVTRDNAQRIADFLSGAVYTLSGSIQRISDEIFLVVPQNVDVTNEIKDLKDSGVIFPWIHSAFGR